MEKKYFQGLGVVLFILGLFLSINLPLQSPSGSFTGADIDSLTSFMGIMLIFVSLIFFVISTTIEEMVEEHIGKGKIASVRFMEGVKGLNLPVNVYVSGKALDRLDTDKRASDLLGLYLKEIRMIASDPKGRPQERIGEFTLSPRGRSGGASKGAIRIVWKYDRVENALYVQDLLYHVTGERYVDNWNKRVERGKINRGFYKNFERVYSPSSQGPSNDKHF